MTAAPARPLGQEEAASDSMPVNSSDTDVHSIDSSCVNSGHVEVDEDRDDVEATALLQVQAVVRSKEPFPHCKATVEETTPHVTSLRAIATPCRARRLPSLCESPSGARDSPVTAADAPVASQDAIILCLNSAIPQPTEPRLPLARIRTGAVL